MSMTWTEVEAQNRWMQEQMPMRVTFFAGDAGLRAWVRGDDVKPQIVAQVIVQGSLEERRIVHEAMKRTKWTCLSERYQP